MWKVNARCHISRDYNSKTVLILANLNMANIKKSCKMTNSDSHLFNLKLYTK